MSTSNAKRLESTSNSHLPEDVILEILLRLPVKTLLRFKCVCKHWCSHIGSQSFVSQHLDHRSNQERLLVRYYKRNADMHAFALFVDEICFDYEEPEHLQMPRTVNEILGPVNGVFCLVGQSRELALLNPAMRQFKPLHEIPHLDVEPHLHPIDNLLGFGLDPMSGNYKIVSIWYFLNDKTTARNYPLVYVYNSGSDSWIHFEDVSSICTSYVACESHCKTYLGGVYYWVMEFADCNVAAILAFDMITEKFQEIQVPDCVKSKIGHLTIYGDSISLLSYDLAKIEKFDIWVMEKEGCWTKVATVGPCQDITWPLCFWKNNELLIETDDSLLTLYDISTKTITSTRFRGKENFSFLSWIFFYKESLVSIEGEGNSCMLWDTSSDFLRLSWMTEHLSRRTDFIARCFHL